MKIGYSRATAIRGLHPSGLREVLIHRPLDLEKLDPKTNAARIAHGVGENKRLLIIEEATRRGVHLLNPGKKEEPAKVEPLIEEKPAEAATENKAKPEDTTK